MGLLLTGNIAKIVIYDKGRVNGVTKYDSPGSHWEPKLVSFIVVLELWENMKNNKGISAQCI